MRYFFLIITLSLLFSCVKKTPLFDGINCSGNCYILSGKAIDSAINTGLAGVEIKFYFRKKPYYGFYPQTDYLGKTHSDANGDYNFKFDGSKYKSYEDGSFYMTAAKGNFFYAPTNPDVVETFILDSSYFNTPVVINFPLFRPAQLTVRFRATTITNFAYLSFHYGYGVTGTGMTIKGGRIIDTTVNLKTAGDLRTFIKWDAYGNGVSIVQRDTLLIPTNGNAQYLVNL